MFCPKCGSQNPDSGRFCRGCGADLGNVSQALANPAASAPRDRRGRPISWESATTKTALGAAFLIIAFVLGATGNGRGWWYWMLVPAFLMLGSGVAQFIQIKRAEGGQVGFAPMSPSLPGEEARAPLPPQRSEPITAESRYKTGDLVPPSVTDATTRHLEIDSEGKTITLPKQ